MKLNSRNIFAIYYKWIYDRLPNDICTFFWGTLFSVLFSILTIPGRMVKFIDRDTNIYLRGIYFWIGYLLFFALGNVFCRPYFGNQISPEDLKFFGPWLLLIIPAVGFIAIGLLVGIIIGIILLIISIKERRENKIRAQYPMGEYQPMKARSENFIAAIKRKHCTKIEWKP